MYTTLYGVAILCVSIFLILLVLVQRGRGGGLTGALGGMGGQSAFGSKAGDVFTKITVWTTFFWIVLCIFGVKMVRTADEKIDASLGSDAAPPPAEGVMGTAPETGDTLPTDTGAAPTDTGSVPTGTSFAPAGETRPAPADNEN